MVSLWRQIGSEELFLCKNDTKNVAAIHFPYSVSVYTLINITVKVLSMGAFRFKQAMLTQVRLILMIWVYSVCHFILHLLDTLLHFKTGLFHFRAVNTIIFCFQSFRIFMVIWNLFYFQVVKVCRAQWVTQEQAQEGQWEGNKVQEVQWVGLVEIWVGFLACHQGPWDRVPVKTLKEISLVIQGWWETEWGCHLVVQVPAQGCPLQVWLVLGLVIYHPVVCQVVLVECPEGVHRLSLQW